MVKVNLTNVQTRPLHKVQRKKHRLISVSFKTEHMHTAESLPAKILEKKQRPIEKILLLISYGDACTVTHRHLTIEFDTLFIQQQNLLH